MAWPTGTQINRLMIKDPPILALGCVWDCLSSTSSSSTLRVILPWGETVTSTVRENVTKKWYNPNNKSQYVSFWAIGCSSGGTYGIANTNFIEASRPTLLVTNIISELSPAADLPKYDRYGVYLEVHISGTGKGSLKISWGNDHMETKTGIVAGNYAYVYNLPSGTHNVCAELFGVV